MRVRLPPTTFFMPRHIVIVGAGVIGLSLALAICENIEDVRVTVVAEHLPDSLPYLSQYTSPWAGAHFRPFPLKNEAELREYPLTRKTWQRMKKFAAENPESSVRLAQGVEYVEKNELYETLGRGYTEGIENFRVLGKEEIALGFAFGAVYDTFVLSAPHYIEFLYRKLRAEYGVEFVKRRLEQLSEAAVYSDSSSCIVVNCTGTGLQWNGGYDPTCFPIRGQTLLVNLAHNNALAEKTITIQHKLGDWTFCINRPLNGGVIIGGTKQINDFDSSVREEDSRAIKERAAKYFPELMRHDKYGNAYFDVIKTNVGFRPARKAGVNLAVEQRSGVTIVNAYGTAGSGFELSYGIGLEVVEKVRQAQRPHRL